jgi:hypothetical protein
MTGPLSGRPEPGEFAEYANRDIEAVLGDDAVEALAAQIVDTLALLAPVDESFAGTFTYAPGKWALKQIVGHLSDDERIFVYRALCLARGEPLALPGFDQNLYARTAGFETRSWTDLLEELRTVRAASLSFFRGLTAEGWERRGVVNGYSASARGLAFHIAGHELHHLRIVREKYLAGIRIA